MQVFMCYVNNLKCRLGCPPYATADTASLGTTGLRMTTIISLRLLPDISSTERKSLLELVRLICKVSSFGTTLKPSTRLGRYSVDVMLKLPEEPLWKRPITVRRMGIMWSAEISLQIPQNRCDTYLLLIH